MKLFVGIVQIIKTRCLEYITPGEPQGPMLHSEKHFEVAVLAARRSRHVTVTCQRMSAFITVSGYYKPCRIPSNANGGC